MLLLSYAETERTFRVHDEDFFVPDPSISAELMSKWEYYTILSYLEIDNSFDVPKISEAIGTSEETVSAIIENLIKLEVVKLSGEKLILTDKCLTTPPNFNRKAVIKVQRENIEKSLDKLSEDSLVGCDFSGMTLAISGKKLSEAIEKIKIFRRSLASFLSDPEENSDAVYRLNIQFFPFVDASSPNASKEAPKEI